MKEILIEDYNPEWKNSFKQLEKILDEHLNDLIITIEHVGSTSVEGLSAKPILDIDIVIDSYEIFPDVVSRLENLGYYHEGDLGIKNREAFGRENNNVPYSDNKTIWMEHHLYVCPKDSKELKRHISFRNYLRHNPIKVKEYSELKKRLAIICGSDRERYWQMKTDFIESILRQIL